MVAMKKDLVRKAFFRKLERKIGFPRMCTVNTHRKIALNISELYDKTRKYENSI